MSVIGRMKFIQQRRMLVALLSRDMREGDLPHDAVDLAGLLFGDKAIWAGTARDAATLQKALKAAIACGKLPDTASRHDAIALAEEEILKDLAEERSLQDAAARGGTGTGSADIEFRVIRASLAPYLSYLAERAVYERVEASVHLTYADLASAEPSDEVLARSLRVDDEDAGEVLAIMESFKAACAAPDGQARPTRNSPLLDRHGRSRWPARGLRRRPFLKRAAAEVLEKAEPLPKDNLVPAPSMVPIDVSRRDQATLMARMRLVLDAELEDALPPDWSIAPLSVKDIIKLMPVPRYPALGVALVAFGHPQLTQDSVLDPDLLQHMEAALRPMREKLLGIINADTSILDFDPPFDWVPVRWRRAADFYLRARRASGETEQGRVWPEPYEYLSAARPEVYTPRARHHTRQLVSIFDIEGELLERPTNQVRQALEMLATRDPISASFTEIAQTRLGKGDALECIVKLWLAQVQEIDADAELSGFVSEGHPTPISYGAIE